MAAQRSTAGPVLSAFSRRRLLGAGGALGIAAIAGSALTGCSDSSKDTNTAADNAKAKLPTYAPVELVKPDLPGTDILMPGYYHYQQHPKAAFQEPPCAGLDSVSIMYDSYVPTPPGADKNAFYQLLQKRAGCDLKISMVPNADYQTKFQTMIAGGDLPDVMNFLVPTPDQPQVMRKLFADLGPYLAGDAAKEYPYLANIPTPSWKATVSNGSVYAVPQPRALTPGALYMRTDIIKKLGANAEPKDYQELRELMTAVTDKKASRWAFASVPGMVSILKQMLGAPNNWSDANGTFTLVYDDDKSKQAVSQVADMVKKGLFHPDAASVTYTGIRDLFFAGRVALTTDGYAGWNLFVESLGGGQEGLNKLGMIVEPKYDGGGDAPQYAGRGFQGLTVVKKGLGEDKTKKVLNLLNFLATPIGSREYLERKYGVEGTDFTWTDGTPTLTDTGKREFMDLQYIVDAPTILGPDQKSSVDYQYNWQKRVTKNLITDPTVGLYSDTYSRKGTQLGKILDDAQNDVIFGRKPISAMDEAYKTWRSQGGDQIAKEYEQSKAAG